MTAGVLSAIDRRVRTAVDSELFGMLQTDAPITRGSSGGALVDSSGRLIGITSAIAVSDVGAEGLGFAIPIELVSRVVGELIENGTASHAFLGVSGATYFEELSNGARVPAGVEIEQVIDETAAALVGLRPGDVIVSFNGDAVTTMDGLALEVRLYSVGDTVRIGVQRGTEDLDVEVTLMERPEGL